MNETNYSDLKKAYKTTAVVIIAALLLMTVFFTVVLTVLAKDFGSEAVGTVQNGLADKLRVIRALTLAAGPIITAVSGGLLYRSYKIREKLMRETAFVECVVKDFLITSRYRQHKRRYTVTPVLEDVKTGELYCAFERDNMSFYSSTYIQNGNSLRSAAIRRGDGTKVGLGDTVRVYIKAFVTREVKIDGNTYTISGGRHKFVHENESFDIGVLKRLRFFKGIVDVER